MKQPILQPLGFDAKTEKVYRALLSLADATAFRVAKASGLKRTSVYHILDNLISMGLASIYTSRGVKRYVAENPNKLKTLFEQKTIIAERLIPLLKADVNQSRGEVKISFFEGKEAIKSISEEALDSKEKTILSIGSSKKFLEFVGGKYGYGQRRREKGIYSRAIRFKGDESVINPKFSQVNPVRSQTPGASRYPTRSDQTSNGVKILDAVPDFPGYITIFDKNVGVILFEGDGYGFVVRSESFSKVMRFVFEILWELK